MIDLDIDKMNQLQFQVDIAGDNSKTVPKIEFKVVSEGLTLSFPATLNGSNYEVSIPPLSAMLAPGSYLAEIAVVLGDRYFVPLSESLVLNPKVQPVVKKVAVKKEETRPTITIEAVNIPAETKMEPLVEVAMVKPPVIFKRKAIVKEGN